jgi:hypothetical protein
MIYELNSILDITEERISTLKCRLNESIAYAGTKQWNQKKKISKKVQHTSK